MIFSIFDWLLSRQEEKEHKKAGSIANQRLQLLLVHDHMRLTPDQKENLRREILEVFAKYVELDASELDLELQKVPDSRQMALVSNVPIKRVLSETKQDPADPEDFELSFEDDEHFININLS